MRRTVLPSLVTLLSVLAVSPLASAERRPNVVVILADDLGYGDLGCYGHPTIRTPNLDRMAAEGLRFTQFYSAGEVCTPSRAALLTGRLPIRSGMCGGKRRVLFPDSGGGLPAEETTLAEKLKEAGYSTACVGKWHLGHLPDFLPTRHGFDSYFGIPYSNDMDRTVAAPKGRQAFLEPKSEYWNVPLLRGAAGGETEVVERPADQTTVTKRYTDEAVAFIRDRAREEKPFFLYLAHTMPHVPLFRSEEFAGVSRRGLYGDVVEELDANVGRVLDAVRETGRARDTLVWFTSDNGPWLTQGLRGGSAGLLKDGKGSTFEGGVRVPAIAWGPGRISPGVTTELGCSMDVFATSCAAAGVEPPRDRILDGYDLSPLLFEGAPGPRKEMFYYRGEELYAVRLGPWKAHYVTQTGYGGSPEPHDPPVLHNLEVDPSETTDLATKRPEILDEIRRVTDEHRRTVESVPSQLDVPLAGPTARPE